MAQEELNKLDDDELVPMMHGNRTLVRPAKDRISRGGIVLPMGIQGEAALSGTVVAVGPDCTFIEKNMEVLFAPYSKYTIPMEEGPYKDHLIINEADFILNWVTKKELRKRLEARKLAAKKEIVDNGNT